ncbi:molybdate ABC transporter substrate-binding protein [Ideonella sp. DXS22W]|uniref:Molybdate ABC transporter substrate-binding protein n=1 Tax=Pseudaquabacterium inlustre TaxID=2984192 RepID=A0ABU9CQ50_9BURK
MKYTLAGCIATMAGALSALALCAPGHAQTPATPPVREPLRIDAAGSLRGALTELARAFEQHALVSVTLNFGPSGLLKDRIEAGAPTQVFASANMSHPQALRQSGQAEVVQAFARNALCVLAHGGFSLQGKSLALRLLDPDVRVGTSTPKADPAGDYAFEMFERIEAFGAGGAGSAAALKAKALQLTGGPNSAQAPVGRNLYGLLLEQGQADVFVTYCTGATEAQRQVPTLKVLAVPDPINVSAVYGMAIIRPASEAAKAFLAFVLSPPGQQMLRTHGFSAP